MVKPWRASLSWSKAIWSSALSSSRLILISSAPGIWRAFTAISWAKRVVVLKSWPIISISTELLPIEPPLDEVLTVYCSTSGKLFKIERTWSAMTKILRSRSLISTVRKRIFRILLPVLFIIEAKEASSSLPYDKLMIVISGISARIIESICKATLFVSSTRWPDCIFAYTVILLWSFCGIKSVLIKRVRLQDPRKMAVMKQMTNVLWCSTQRISLS